MNKLASIIIMTLFGANISADNNIQISLFAKRQIQTQVCNDCTSSIATCENFTWETRGKLLTAYSYLKNKAEKNLSMYIRKKLNEYHYDDYERISGHILSNDQEFALGVFLELKENGNSEQKKYITTVERLFLSDSKSRRKLFSSGKHDLFMFFQQPYSTTFLKEFTIFLNAVANYREAKGTSLKESYQQVLSDWELNKEKNRKFFKEKGVYQKAQNLKQCGAFQAANR